MKPMALCQAALKNGLRYLPGFDEWRRMGVDPRAELLGMDRLDEQWAHLSRFSDDDQIQGRTFLELGPGETVGLGLILWLKGARSYVGVEASRRPLVDQRNRAWHCQVVRTACQGRWGRTDPARSHPEALERMLQAGRMPDAVRVCAGTAERLPLRTNSIEHSFSFSVLEHVRDVPAVLSELQRVARDGGRSEHAIDLTSHHGGEGPLDLLEYGDVVWALIGSRRSGSYPNRLRASHYVACARSVGWFHAETRVLSELTWEETSALQPSFAPRFRAMSAASLQPLHVALILAK